MTIDVDFPSKNDFIFEGDDISDNVRNLNSVLNRLCNSPIDEYPPKTDEFLKTSLPSIWKTIQSSSHPSRALIKEISTLCSEYCNLCEYTNLIPSMVLAITTTFDGSFQKGQFYQIEELPENEINDILNNNGNQSKGRVEDLLHPNRPPANNITTSLVTSVLTSGIFRKTKELSSKGKLTFEQISAVVQLFTCVESSMSVKMVSATLPMLIESTISLISSLDIQTNPDLSYVCQFLSTFARMAPTMVDNILPVFCTLSEKSPAKTRLIAITDMIHIVNTIGIGKSAALVKSAMVNALKSSSQTSILTSVYDFLPSLSKMTQFDDTDLHDLLVKARSGDRKLVSSLVDVINSVDRHVDSFGQELLTYDIISPSLYCAVIGKTHDESITRSLFHQLLASTDKLMTRETINHVELNERIKMHMNEEGVDLIKLLTFLFLCAPNVDTVRDFIVRVFDLPVLPPELIPMLRSFARKLNDFNSTPTIIALFNVVIEKLKNKPNDAFTSSLITVVTLWINSSNNINTVEFIRQLSQLDFSTINDCVPCLASVLVEKCADEQTNQNFLFKVLNDSVPPKHAQWLVGSIFRLIHEDEKLVERFFITIMSHIQQGEKYYNGVYLLYNAATYEADYFMLGERIGFIQNVILHLKDDNTIDLSISLHPFHSTRRIYTEVAHQLNFNTDQFILMINDGQQERYLKYNTPLQTIAIGLMTDKDQEKAIELRFDNNNEDHPINPTMIKTPFLNLLSQKVSVLFDLIKAEPLFENDIIFQIIMLFPQLKIIPNNPIQEVLVGKIEDAMILRDSIRIFPFAVAASSSHAQKMGEYITELASHRYDVVSMAVACKAIYKSDVNIIMCEKSLKQCLIDCPNAQIRSISAKIVSTETNPEHLINLISSTLKKENRPKSKQFYECISRFKIMPEIFVPFYQTLEQFEFSFYGEIDQTFVSLLGLLPQTEEMIDLTMKRLFSPPKCKNETIPFVHTTESWVAALKFIQSELAIPHLHALFSVLQNLSSTAELSSDYTYKGRCGILNMGSTCYINALFQVLNTFQHISQNIISKKSDNLTPFMLELRNCLAKLRFERGSILSMSALTKTIDPKFNPLLQQDIEEFFNGIVNKVSDDLKDNDDVTDRMKIEITSNCFADGKIVSSRVENYYYLLLQTKNVSRLDDAFDLYFEEEIIEGGYAVEGSSEKVPACRWCAITKWPDYLVIQLQRWEYTLETCERHKLAHELAFPVELKGQDIKCHYEEQKCPYDYTLAGVVIHQGTADQGHYMAIVLGDDDEWYYCNDRRIEYFDINDLATFAYGVSDGSQPLEEVYTGYLLFYKKVGIEKVEVRCQPDLEEAIDEENAKNWPSTIFYSHEFVEYAKEMILEYKSNINMLDVALTVLFKIAVCNDVTLRQWSLILMNQVMIEGSLCTRFFEYVETEIGISLGQLFSISENISNDLSSLFNYALSKLPDTTAPIAAVLKCVPEAQSLKRMFCQFLFDTIASMCQLLEVNWTQEDDTLVLMLNILSMPITKEVQRQVIRTYTNALNMVIGLFVIVVQERGCTDAVLMVFDIQRMNRIGSIYKKCENFSKLLLHVNTIRPDVFTETAEATSSTLELLSQIIPQQQVENEDTMNFDLDFMFPSLEILLFCSEKAARRESSNVLLNIIGKKDIQILLYLKEALIKDDITRPPVQEESTVSLFVCGLLGSMNKNIISGDDDVCLNFITCVLRLCYVSPNSLIREFRLISDSFLRVKNNKSPAKRKLLKILHHLIAYDRTILEDESYQDIFDAILNSDVTSTYATQLLAAFHEKANLSVLSGACVEYYLTSEFDQNAEILLKLLRNEELKPAKVEIPKEANDFMKLRFANELWMVWPEMKAELSEFMLSAFKHARPFSLYQNSVTLHKTIELLKTYCPDDLTKIIEEMK